jgi:hypothetical protein
VTSCHDCPLTSLASNSGYRQQTNNLTKASDKLLNKNLQFLYPLQFPEFLTHFQKQQMGSLMLASYHLKDIANKKVFEQASSSFSFVPARI